MGLFVFPIGTDVNETTYLQMLLMAFMSNFLGHKKYILNQLGKILNIDLFWCLLFLGASPISLQLLGNAYVSIFSEYERFHISKNYLNVGEKLIVNNVNILRKTYLKDDRLEK